MSKFRLTLKLNLVLVPAMALLLAAALALVRNVADRTALEETDRTARLIMAAAQATFDYTVEQVNPALEAKYDFLVQSVSSFAATETIGRLQKQFHDYRYHVAAPNPTNRRDLADPWETLAIQTLASEPGRAEFTAVRDLAAGRFAFIAVPIRITNEACLACHSVPERAPRTMIDAYGREDGFGWKLNEVVAAQVVSVPMSVAQERADTLYRSVMLTLVACFGIVLLLANLALRIVVVKRIKRLSQIADRVSKGDVDWATPAAVGADEISSLERAFERMRVSLSLAMKTLRDGAG